jgi:two-component sensor histidine kinase
MQRRVSYTTRAILTFVIPWIAASLFSFWYLSYIQRVAGEANARRHLGIVSDMFATSVGTGLNDGDFSLVQKAFDWSRLDKNVGYICILDEQDEVLFQTAPVPAIPLQRVKGAPFGITKTESGLLSITSIVPAGRKLGTVVLLYSLESVEQEIRSAQATSIVVSLVVLLVGLWGTRLLIRQAAELESARVYAERQAVTVQAQAADLSSMNATLEQNNRTLIETQRELQQAHDELERRVEERTNDLARANASLNTSLREKEILLKEVHHRVKNNMQIISSLLFLQSSYVRDGYDVELFRESQMRVKSMAMVHERLYRSEDLSSIQFADYVRTIAHELLTSYRREGLEIITSIDDVSFGVDIAIPCGLLITELVTNAIKHAFPDGRKGRIEIAGYCADGRMYLSVSDNGIGYPAQVDFHGGETLGVILIGGLTDQLEGTIAIDRDNGSRVTICFPLNQSEVEGESIS